MAVRLSCLHWHKLLTHYSLGQEECCNSLTPVNASCAVIIDLIFNLQEVSDTRSLQRRTGDVECWLLLSSHESRSTSVTSLSDHLHLFVVIQVAELYGLERWK